MTREEAINEIKSWAIPSKKGREVLETLIPELRESKDERARKAAQEGIEYLERKLGWDAIGDTDILDVKEYLEKQKENNEYVFRPLAGTDITIAAEQAIRRAMEGDNLVLAFNGVYLPVRKYNSAKELVDEYYAYLEKQKEQKSQYIYLKFREGDVIQKITDGDIVTIAEVDTDAEEYRLTNSGFIPFEYEHLWYIVEQKPAEIDEYKIIKKHITEDSLSSEVNKRLKECGWEVVEKSAEIDFEDWDTLGYIRDIVREHIRKDEDFNILDKWLTEHYIINKPAEWSEEDENAITTAIRACRYMTENFENSTKQYEDAIERLKSLRPSWKPSEEQLDALKEASVSWMNEKMGNTKILESLYEQLKKL